MCEDKAVIEAFCITICVCAFFLLCGYGCNLNHQQKMLEIEKACVAK